MNVFIGAVCVAFNPDNADFLKTINAALAEVDCLVVVNNGVEPLSFLSTVINNRLYVIENNDNLGIAEALNIGITFLSNKNCSHYLLLDQDSIIPENTISSLLNAFDELNAKDINVAAVGPSFFNPILGEVSAFAIFKKIVVRKAYGTAAKPLVLVHILITSGSLIKAEAMSDIGLMETGLFIDYVDIEWCLRALSKGYSLYGDSRIIMNHTLGDKFIPFFNKRMLYHPPIRYYYMCRNNIHLMRRSYIPLNWRLALFIGMVVQSVFFSLIPDDRFLQFKKIIVGYYHGIRGKYGRFDRLSSVSDKIGK